MRKIFLFLCLVSVFLGGFICWRMRPRMTAKETYNHILQSEKFLSKIHSPIPEWMEKQLDRDFKEVTPVTADALEKAYEIMMSRIQEPIFLDHYRILDNQLYKYLSKGRRLPTRDTHFERALKTLLSQVKVPDLDFILCPMDGIPEVRLAPDFYRLEQQVPIFGQAKLQEIHPIILIPDQMSVGEDWFQNAAETLKLRDQIPWTSKIAKAFWRGRISDNPLNLPKRTPRASICLLGKRHRQFVDAAFIPDSSLLPHEELETSSSFASKEEHLRFKYLPVLDGNMCTYPGFQWRLLSDSLALKQQSNQIQWFYGALEPYKHYLPIANDMSDLLEKIEWAENHEPEVLEMIQNAQQFVSENLMTEDCYRYLYLALQRYAKHQEIDFKSLKKKTKKDPQWINIQYRKRVAFLRTVRRIMP